MNYPKIEFITTSIADVILIQPKVFADERGFFLETFRLDRFEEAGINTAFVQDNHSGSSQGVLRGLHYQIKQTQGKLIRVIFGEIYDVAVDIRRSSPAFGKCVCITLSAKDKQQIWIPPGFAHGYYVLSERVEIVYKVTDYYAPEWERTLLWNDPTLNIQWPLINNQLPALSTRDAAGKKLLETDLFD